MKKAWKCTNPKHPTSWAEIQYNDELELYSLYFQSVWSTDITYRSHSKKLSALKATLSREMKCKSEWEEIIQ